jgi:Mg-chelatase subunit ChlD
VHVDNRDLKPFFAISRKSESNVVRGRIALVLVDISGSMRSKMSKGETRFTAVKGALSQFLDEFQDGTDQIAIVPFESHDVEKRIRNARFAGTKLDAQQQVQNLPEPQSRNNTGLYSAVVFGLDALSGQVRKKDANAGSPESLLIVMTDGANDVQRGDDAELLVGARGLEKAAKKVGESSAKVIGVGFGEANEKDLRKLSSNATDCYMAAEDTGRLRKIFTNVRTLLSNQIQVTFSPDEDRPSLASKTLHISVKLRFLPNGPELVSDQRIWTPPGMGLLYDGTCDRDEKEALGIPPDAAGSGPLLRAVFVFLGLGTLLLVLWFWVPRLVWPDRYIGIVPSHRWAAHTSSGSRPAKRAPPGFQGGNAGSPPQRMPSDATVVQPQPDFTKTRLGGREGARRDRE